MNPSDKTFKLLSEQITNHGHALALMTADGRIITADGRGVAPLYNLFTDSPSALRGATVVDKVIGKGAAALMVVAGVSSVKALTASRAAKKMFDYSNVDFHCDNIVDAIINRRGDGPCPVEALCADCATADQCIPLIEQFLKSLNH